MDIKRDYYDYESIRSLRKSFMSFKKSLRPSLVCWFILQGCLEKKPKDLKHQD